MERFPIVIESPGNDALAIKDYLVCLQLLFLVRDESS